MIKPIRDSYLQLLQYTSAAGMKIQVCGIMPYTVFPWDGGSSWGTEIS